LKGFVCYKAVNSEPGIIFYICVFVTKDKTSRYKKIVKLNNVSGVILAGGTNTRFDGKIKANLVINGRTIISRIEDILIQVFSEIIIVTNTPEEFMEYNKYKIVSDQFRMVGPLGGIHAAMKAATSEALFVVAGDMPLLDKRMIIRQVEYFRNNKCDVLIPAVNYNIEPLHAIYNRSILKKIEEFLSCNLSYAVRDFLGKVVVKYLEVDDSEETMYAFTNINSPSDIPIVEEKLRNRDSAIFTNFNSEKKQIL
jgi:molybdopterin-guanine dinucleotide biosynthesis protein A